MNVLFSHIILIDLPDIFIIKRFITLFTISLIFLKKYTTIGHFPYLSMFYKSVEVKHQMLIARLKAHGPIFFRSFMFLLDLRENKYPH